MALLDDVKVAVRVVSSAYDTELTDLIKAALKDMGITDIKTAMLVETNPDPLIKRAVITYCKMNFGYAQFSDTKGSAGYYANLKAAYDEQKAQMLMSSQYTDWGDSDA